MKEMREGEMKEGAYNRRKRGHEKLLNERRQRGKERYIEVGKSVKEGENRRY